MVVQCVWESSYVHVHVCGLVIVCVCVHVNSCSRVDRQAQYSVALSLGHWSHEDTKPVDGVKEHGQHAPAAGGASRVSSLSPSRLTGSPCGWRCWGRLSSLLCSGSLCGASSWLQPVLQGPCQGGPMSGPGRSLLTGRLVKLSQRGVHVQTSPEDPKVSCSVRLPAL